MPAIMVIIGIALTKIPIIIDPTPVTYGDTYYDNSNAVYYNLNDASSTAVPAGLVSGFHSPAFTMILVTTNAIGPVNAT